MGNKFSDFNSLYWIFEKEKCVVLVLNTYFLLRFLQSKVPPSAFRLPLNNLLAHRAGDIHSNTGSNLPSYGNWCKQVSIDSTQVRRVMWRKKKQTVRRLRSLYNCRIVIQLLSWIPTSELNIVFTYSEIMLYWATSRTKHWYFPETI